MMWSKLKKLAETLLADSVKGHLQFYITQYGPGESDIMTRAWITWDKIELINMSTVECLMGRGIYSRWDFYGALEEYVGLPIEAALHSPNEIIKAWAMFDRRLGKRRLLKLQPGDVEQPLVKQFYDLRCKAEAGLKPSISGVL